MATPLSCPCGHQFTITCDSATASCPACGQVLPIIGLPPGNPDVAIQRQPSRILEPAVPADTGGSPALPVRRRRRWLLVASILLLVVGGIGLGLLSLDMYLSSRVAALEQRLDEQPSRRQALLRETEHQVRGQHVQLTVAGPATVQVGAPNAYRIEVRNLNNQAVPARLDALVRDEAGQVVHQEKGIASQGEHLFVLPRELPARPRTQMTLELTAETEAGVQAKLSEKLTLIEPVYVTHLTTDKPMYQPGEVVSFRSLTLERFGLQPADVDFRLTYTITAPNGDKVFRLDGPSRLVGTDGRPIHGPDGKPLRGIGAGEWAIPKDARGGEFTLTVSDADSRFPPQERQFLVNRYQLPRLSKELEFTRRSYGPGDTVLAAGKVTRSEGGAPVANQPVQATILIDGNRHDAAGQAGANATLALQTDAQGQVTVSFRLPASIERGDASLSLRFTDGGNVETIIRSIPVVVKKLQVVFYPEGGDLVAGLPNRVYFQALTPLGKPAELKGRIVDTAGTVVAEVRTLNDPEQPGANQGMGQLTFTPRAGTNYELKIDTPAGIEGKFALPVVKDEGVVLSVPDGATRTNEPIRVQLRSAGADRQLVVGAFCRSRLLDQKPVTARKGELAEVMLRPVGEAAGVYRITVFDERAELVPVAERLIYRRPTRALKLSVVPDQERYVPGDKVTLLCAARSEENKPIPAILLVAAVDRSVLGLADEKTARSLPAHFYLTTEVRQPDDLEHADFLLSEHPRAVAALDLLLGVQGWRRFAEQDPHKFREQHGSEAARLLTAIGDRPVRTSNTAEVQKAFRPALAAKHAKVENGLAMEHVTLLAEYEAAGQSRKAYQATIKKLGLVLLIGLGLVLVLSVLVVLIVVTAMVLRWAGTKDGTGGLAGAIVVVGFLVCIGSPAVFFLGGNTNGTFSGVSAAISAGGGGGSVVTKKGSPRDKEGLKDGAPREPELRPIITVDGSLPSGIPADRGNGPKPASERPAPESPLAQIEKEMAKALPPGRPVTGPRRARAEQVSFQEQERQRTTGGRSWPPAPAARSFGAEEQPDAATLPPLMVREYAHQRMSDNPAIRSDFTETVCWHPVLVLPNGRAEVSFQLGDSVTRFEVLAAGHTLDGRLGSATTVFESRLPFSIEPRLPLEVTTSDRIEVPVAIANNTASRREVHLLAQAQGLTLEKPKDVVTVEPGQTTRRLLRVRPAVVDGQARLVVGGTAEGLAPDIVERSLRVVPEGFPVTGSFSGTLEKAARHQVVLPEDWTKGTLRCQVQLYPSVLSDLQTGLEGMLREPFG